jgi:hypothetical protein
MLNMAPPPKQLSEKIEPLLAALGAPMSTAFVAEWLDAKPSKKDWQFNKKKGFGVSLDGHSRLIAIHLFSKGVEKSTVSATLPTDLTWSLTRADLTKRYGKPEITGEPSGGIMGTEFAFDRWTFPDGGLWVEYTPEGPLRRVQLLAPADPKELFWLDLQVYADYSQFYVADQAYTADTGTIWDDPSTSKRQLAVGDGLVAIGTKRYGTVPVTVSWHPRAPKLNTTGVSRVNECGLTITSKLVIGNPISKPELTVMEGIDPGHYAVRILYMFQDQVTNDETGNDKYLVELWPVDSPHPLTYLKPR